MRNLCLNVTFGSKIGLRDTSHSHLLFVSLLFIVVLFFSCFTSVFSNVSLFALGTPATVIVATENDIKTAIYNTENGVPVTIALVRDVLLTSTLDIPAKKNITLTSDSDVPNLRRFWVLQRLKFQT